MIGGGYHRPVMVEEVIEHLDCGPGGVVVDGTLGGGGHGVALLEASSPDGFLVGIDRDDEALEEAEKHLRPYRGRYRLARGNFGDLGELLRGMEIERVDGLLLERFYQRLA